MAINLATKYSKKVAERFSLQSLTDPWAGHDYDFTGVKTISIYSINTVATTPYTRSGTERFGTLTELEDTKQDLTMTQDKAFTYSIDKGNNIQQFNVKQATRSLKREIDEVITPELDTYRLGKWATGAGLTTAEGAALDSSNVIEAIFTGAMKMNNAKVPKKNRVMFIKESIYMGAKLSTQVMGTNNFAASVLKNGVVGVLDGMKVVPVPDSMMPENTNFIIKYKGCSVDPVQLKTYRILKDQRGVDGDVVEGRIIYDSFVLTTKNKGIYTSTYVEAP